jgi:hypothetical protein
MLIIRTLSKMELIFCHNLLYTNTLHLYFFEQKTSELRSLWAMVIRSERKF